MTTMVLAVRERTRALEARPKKIISLQNEFNEFENTRKKKTKIKEENVIGRDEAGTVVESVSQ